MYDLAQVMFDIHHLQERFYFEDNVVRHTRTVTLALSPSHPPLPPSPPLSLSPTLSPRGAQRGAPARARGEEEEWREGSDPSLALHRVLDGCIHR